MRGRNCASFGSQFGIVAAVLTVASGAVANGEAEYVAPVDVPTSHAQGRSLPFPVAEEAQPRGTPANATEALPDDFTFHRIPEFAQPVAQQNAVGNKSECTQAVILRGSKIESGKVIIPPGGLGYLTETWPPALPLRQDVICVAGAPNTLVEIEQSIVTRKNVTLDQSEGVVLGSEVFKLRNITEFGDARSAVVNVSSVSGFDWARLGTGSLEVSVTEPGWHAKTFHYGMHQGRAEEITPKTVKFAWLSGLRTDSVILAEKREFAAMAGNATDIPLSGGGQVRVVRVNGAARTVELGTPDGPKVINANVDRRGLPADTAARKKLILVGSSFAALVVPDASDFGTNRVHLEVYSRNRQFRHGNLAADARNWKTYPMAHYTGAVVGVYWVNEQPIELTPTAASFAGPYDAFKLVTTWGQGNDLTSFHLQDSKGGKSVPVSASGRKSINLLAGNGPTLHAVLSRTGAAPANELHERLAQLANAPQGPNVTEIQAAAKAAALEEFRRAESSEDWMSPKRLQAARVPAAAGGAAGLLLGFGLGRIGRRRRAPRHRDDD